MNILALILAGLALYGLVSNLNLAITASQVLAGSTSPKMTRTAGEAVTAGQVIYLKAADDRFWLAQADGTSAEALVRGVALHDAAVGQPLQIQTKGSVTIGAAAAMTVGEIYVLSATAGGIAPEADILTSTHYVTLLGVATSASVLELQILNSGAQIP